MANEFPNFPEIEQPNPQDRFNKFVNLGITAEDMIGMLGKDKIDPKDMEPFMYPKLKDPQLYLKKLSQ